MLVEVPAAGAGGVGEGFHSPEPLIPGAGRLLSGPGDDDAADRPPASPSQGASTRPSVPRDNADPLPPTGQGAAPPETGSPGAAVAGLEGDDGFPTRPGGEEEARAGGSSPVGRGAAAPLTRALGGASMASLPALRGDPAAPGPRSARAISLPGGGLYAGDLRGGVPHGRGVLRWPSGARYEGEFSEGKLHGVGALAPAKGGVFYAHWVDGELDGDAVYRPPPPPRAVGAPGEGGKAREGRGGADRADRVDRDGGGDGVAPSTPPHGLSPRAAHPPPSLIYLRRYERGQLVAEESLDAPEMSGGGHRRGHGREGLWGWKDYWEERQQGRESGWGEHSHHHPGREPSFRDHLRDLRALGVGIRPPSKTPRDHRKAGGGGAARGPEPSALRPAEAPARAPSASPATAVIAAAAAADVSGMSSVSAGLPRPEAALGEAEAPRDERVVAPPAAATPIDPSEALAVTLSPVSMRPAHVSRKKAAKAAYRAPQPGEAVFKGHRSYDLVRQLQLGIMFSVAQAGGRASGIGSTGSSTGGGGLWSVLGGGGSSSWTRASTAASLTSPPAPRPGSRGSETSFRGSGTGGGGVAGGGTGTTRRGPWLDGARLADSRGESGSTSASSTPAGRGPLTPLSSQPSIVLSANPLLACLTGGTPAHVLTPRSGDLARLAASELGPEAVGLGAATDLTQATGRPAEAAAVTAAEPAAGAAAGAATGPAPSSPRSTVSPPTSALGWLPHPTSGADGSEAELSSPNPGDPLSLGGLDPAGTTAVALYEPPPPLPDEAFSVTSSVLMPAFGESPGFRWKDYAPQSFRNLRLSWGIDDREYLLSLTGLGALRLLPSPGKSGSAFLLSDDDRFLIKTVRKEEMVLVLRFLPRYYRHRSESPDTLLSGFFGLHRVTPAMGRNVRFLVMGNVFPTDLRLHRQYDLKGSLHGRTVGPEKKRDNPHATLKDLDVDSVFLLSPANHRALLRQLTSDLELCIAGNVMDYSLLLGVHFVRWGNDAWVPPGELWSTAAGASKEALEAELSAAGRAGSDAPAPADSPAGPAAGTATDRAPLEPPGPLALPLTETAGPPPRPRPWPYPCRTLSSTARSFALESSVGASPGWTEVAAGASIDAAPGTTSTLDRFPVPGCETELCLHPAVSPEPTQDGPTEPRVTVSLATEGPLSKRIDGPAPPSPPPAHGLAGGGGAALANGALGLRGLIPGPPLTRLPSVVGDHAPANAALTTQVTTLVSVGRVAALAARSAAARGVAASRDGCAACPAQEDQRGGANAPAAAGWAHGEAGRDPREDARTPQPADPPIAAREEPAAIPEPSTSSGDVGVSQRGPSAGTAGADAGASTAGARKPEAAAAARRAPEAPTPAPHLAPALPSARSRPPRDASLLAAERRAGLESVAHALGAPRKGATVGSLEPGGVATGVKDGKARADGRLAVVGRPKEAPGGPGIGAGDEGRAGAGGASPGAAQPLPDPSPPGAGGAGHGRGPGGLLGRRYATHPSDDGARKGWLARQLGGLACFSGGAVAEGGAAAHRRRRAELGRDDGDGWSLPGTRAGTSSSSRETAGPSEGSDAPARVAAGRPAPGAAAAGTAPPSAARRATPGLDPSAAAAGSPARVARRSPSPGLPDDAPSHPAVTSLEAAQEASPHVRFGFAMPALAVRRDADGLPTDDAPEPVLLYLGIIDFLQDYNFRKRAEHAIKVTVHAGAKVSVTSPDAYAGRFLDFMSNLFLEEPTLALADEPAPAAP